MNNDRAFINGHTHQVPIDHLIAQYREDDECFKEDDAPSPVAKKVATVEKFKPTAWEVGFLKTMASCLG